MKVKFGVPVKAIKSNDNERLNIRWPKELLTEIDSMMEKDNYSRRLFSKWVCKSINEIISDGSFEKYIDEFWLADGTEMESKNLTISRSLHLRLMDILKDKKMRDDEFNFSDLIRAIVTIKCMESK
jgi:hypothetical protein